MYPIPSNETLVETRACRQCGTEFPITEKDLEFYDKVSPTFAGVKYQIPAPTLCPDCRQQRRLSFRNERELYKRKCDLNGKEIISMYSPDKPNVVYNTKDWWSDSWDVREYGKDFDFSRDFFSQFKELLQAVPKAAVLHEGEMVNSEYTNFSWWLKDCYLISDAGKSENCMFGNLIGYAKDSNDCSFVIGSEHCYDCVNCFGCRKLFHSFLCNDCSDSYFLKNCNGCSNCFGCMNLTNQQYHIFNQPFKKEEYEVKLVKLLVQTDIADRVKAFYLSQPNEALFLKNNENCSGDFISNSKNVHCSFDAISAESCKFCQMVLLNTKDCYDITTFGDQMSLSYELSASGWAQGKTSMHHCLFWAYCYYGWSELFYCVWVHWECSNCFWCTGLVGKSYCILNKQYSREEYEALVPRIIEHMQATGEWGEFFPSSLSPFGYHETIASEFFPLSREEARSQGFNWSDYEAPFPKMEKSIPASRLPDRIEGVPDDILNWAIECEVTGKPFRIIKQELEFYRKHGLPIPHRHPDERHLDRIALRNPRTLFERSCDHCGKPMVTTYAPERPEIVYCEECYRKEVV